MFSGGQPPALTIPHIDTRRMWDAFNSHTLILQDRVHSNLPNCWKMDF